MRPIRRIDEYIRDFKGKRRVKQSTQFIVGAAGESDREIFGRSFDLYGRH